MSEMETVNDIFRGIRSRDPDQELVYYKEKGPGQEKPESWKHMTVYEFERNVYLRSLALDELGVHPESDIALISDNRPEWHLYDFAILGLRASTVPIHSNLSPEQTQYILEDSESTHLIVSIEEYLEKVLKGLDKIKTLEKIILLDHEGEYDHPNVVTEEELLDRVQEKSYGELRSFYDEKTESVRPDDLATLIYTSGTTGAPKGVMLTHHNIVSNIQGCKEVFRLSEDDRSLSFLPLSHAFERIADYAYLREEAQIAYGSVDTVTEDIKTVQPTVLASVPRLFEKIKEKIDKKIQEGSFIRKFLFNWALEAGYEAARMKHIEGKPPGPWTLFKTFIANTFILRSVHNKLGGNVRFFLSGGAALERSVCRFFLGLSLPIVEGYGMSEMSPVVALNPLHKIRPGTVGVPLPNVEVKIADDGEILTRGPNMMKGYYRKHEKSTRALEGGWFHTGDVGELDEEGYLKVKGRKKSAIVTSWGENIIPQPLEGELRKSTFIEHAVLIGNDRPFVTALIQPLYEKIEQYASEEGIQFESREELLRSSEVHSLIRSEIEKIQDDWADYEQVKQFFLIPQKLSVQRGDLTPTMKVRRHILKERYEDEIEDLYKKPAPDEDSEPGDDQPGEPQEQDVSEETRATS